MTPVSQIITDSIKNAMGRFENLDLRVQKIWLNPAQLKELAGQDDFDPNGLRQLEEAMPGYKGGIYGAMVFESDLVPPMHIAVLPDGFDGGLIDSVACFRL